MPYNCTMTNTEVKIGLRLKGKDADKFVEMKKSVEMRIGKVTTTSLVREFMGLDFPPRKITQADRDFLSGLIASLPMEKPERQSQSSRPKEQRRKAAS